MSTFLELVQDAARESGSLAGGVNLGSVVGATGRADKVVSWVRKAWRNIQNERVDWLWLQREFIGPLSAGTARYTAASFNITRFREWKQDRVTTSNTSYRVFTIYDTAKGPSDEGSLTQIDYETWRVRYDRSTQVQSRPTEWAISPAGELCVGPIPDRTYTIRGEYVASAQNLAADADTPEMPAHFHDLIVWEALRLMSAADEAVTALQTSNNEYNRLRFALTAEQLPKMYLAHRSIA